MSIFDQKRLPKDLLQIDTNQLRRGFYSDAYFNNTVRILETLAKDPDYVVSSDVIPTTNFNNGDIEVEMQFFTRRKPFSLVAGVDEALAILEEGTGYYQENGTFINTFNDLEIEAVHDGTFVEFTGDSMQVQPVLKVRGRYRDFAVLETPILGSLTEATKVATNVYNVLVAANGKEVLFFPARFAHYKIQALHGYAYSLAVQAYNHKFDKKLRASVSTDAQGAYWGGKGGGTIAHATIASFLGNTVEATLQFARILPPSIPRIALIDFHNDCRTDALAVMQKLFTTFWELYSQGKESEAEQYRLFGVRPDTSATMRDQSLPPVGDNKLDFGVNPRLIRMLREAIDNAWLHWQLPQEALPIAESWCKAVKIIATGGFTVEKITEFEKDRVPVDIYGVGSSLLENSSKTGTANDYTADIVRVKVSGSWHKLCKAGRQPNENINLVKIQ